MGLDPVDPEDDEEVVDDGEPVPDEAEPVAA
jgi:hypothetical protein